MLGDGDFLMTAQEIGLCVTNDIPVVFVIQDSSGFMSIRGGQRKQTSRHIGTEFNRPDGTPYSPDFKAVGDAFGLRSYRVESNDELEPVLREAVESGRPALVCVPTDRDAAGPWVPGWWDFPVPAYITDERQKETGTRRTPSSTSEPEPAAFERTTMPVSSPVTRRERDLLGTREVPPTPTGECTPCGHGRTSRSPVS